MFYVFSSGAGYGKLMSCPCGESLLLNEPRVIKVGKDTKHLCLKCAKKELSATLMNLDVTINGVNEIRDNTKSILDEITEIEANG